ncbi:hypothetical protein B0H14DRAFT_2557097 [Mycena olivaceomarginata]|nr:hypothetical protein B0H14DRAFT_2557097 [Mycena olivaceomarginata]
MLDPPPRQAYDVSPVDEQGTSAVPAAQPTAQELETSAATPPHPIAKAISTEYTRTSGNAPAPAVLAAVKDPLSTCALVSAPPPHPIVDFIGDTQAKEVSTQDIRSPGHAPEPAAPSAVKDPPGESSLASSPVSATAQEVKTATGHIPTPAILVAVKDPPNEMVCDLPRALAPVAVEAKGMDDSESGGMETRSTTRAEYSAHSRDTESLTVPRTIDLAAAVMQPESSPTPVTARAPIVESLRAPSHPIEKGFSAQGTRPPGNTPAAATPAPTKDLPLTRASTDKYDEPHEAAHAPAMAATPAAVKDPPLGSPCELLLASTGASAAAEDEGRGTDEKQRERRSTNECAPEYIQLKSRYGRSGVCVTDTVKQFESMTVRFSCAKSSGPSSRTGSLAQTESSDTRRRGPPLHARSRSCTVSAHAIFSPLLSTAAAAPTSSRLPSVVESATVGRIPLASEIQPQKLTFDLLRISVEPKVEFGGRMERPTGIDSIGCVKYNVLYPSPAPVLAVGVRTVELGGRADIPALVQQDITAAAETHTLHALDNPSSCGILELACTTSTSILPLSTSVLSFVTASLGIALVCATVWTGTITYPELLEVGNTAPYQSWEREGIGTYSPLAPWILCFSVPRGTVRLLGFAAHAGARLRSTEWEEERKTPIIPMGSHCLHHDRWRSSSLLLSLPVLLRPNSSEFGLKILRLGDGDATQASWTGFGDKRERGVISGVQVHARLPPRGESPLFSFKLSFFSLLYLLLHLRGIAPQDCHPFRVSPQGPRLLRSWSASCALASISARVHHASRTPIAPPAYAAGRCGVIASRPNSQETTTASGALLAVLPTAVLSDTGIRAMLPTSAATCDASCAGPPHLAASRVPSHPGVQLGRSRTLVVRCLHSLHDLSARGFRARYSSTPAVGPLRAPRPRGAFIYNGLCPVPREGDGSKVRWSPTEHAIAPARFVAHLRKPLKRRLPDQPLPTPIGPPAPYPCSWTYTGAWNDIWMGSESSPSRSTTATDYFRGGQGWVTVWYGIGSEATTARSGFREGTEPEMEWMQGSPWSRRSFRPIVCSVLWISGVRRSLLHGGTEYLALGSLLKSIDSSLPLNNARSPATAGVRRFSGCSNPQPDFARFLPLPLVHPLIVAGASLRWSASEESSAASEHDDENWGDERRARTAAASMRRGVLVPRRRAAGLCVEDEIARCKVKTGFHVAANYHQLRCSMYTTYLSSLQMSYEDAADKGRRALAPRFLGLKSAVPGCKIALEFRKVALQQYQTKVCCTASLGMRAPNTGVGKEDTPRNSRFQWRTQPLRNGVVERLHQTPPSGVRCKKVSGCVEDAGCEGEAGEYVVAKESDMTSRFLLHLQHPVMPDLARFRSRIPRRDGVDALQQPDYYQHGPLKHF